MLPGENKLRWRTKQKAQNAAPASKPNIEEFVMARIQLDMVQSTRKPAR